MFLLYIYIEQYNNSYNFLYIGFSRNSKKKEYSYIYRIIRNCINISYIQKTLAFMIWPVDAEKPPAAVFCIDASPNFIVLLFMCLYEIFSNKICQFATIFYRYFPIKFARYLPLFFAKYLPLFFAYYILQIFAYYFFYISTTILYIYSYYLYSEYFFFLFLRAGF